MLFETNSFCAFGLNLEVFLLVGKTSVLTMNIARVVTPIKLFGYRIAFLGVAYVIMQSCKHLWLEKLKLSLLKRLVGKLLEESKGDDGSRKNESSS
ncbi:hypothetical protein Hanom_Chr10g00960071 [Helianthus anomalus]